MGLTDSTICNLPSVQLFRVTKMFRLIASTSSRAVRSWTNNVTRVQGARMMSSASTETEAEFDARYEAFFNRKDIDGWEVRKAFGDLAGMDLIPEPTIVSAALRACRRLNDYSLTTRILEVVKIKCGDRPEVYAYMLQELRPTLDELGISTPEELGYDKPELALPNPYEIH